MPTCDPPNQGNSGAPSAHQEQFPAVDRHLGLMPLVVVVWDPSCANDLAPTDEPRHRPQIGGINDPRDLALQAPRPSQNLKLERVQLDAPSQRLPSDAPLSLEALQRARDTGQPASTGRVTLVQEPGRQFGLLVFLPVYGRRLPYATVEEPRQSLQGYVTGVFRIGDMVEASLQGLEREGIVLRVEDETAPADQRMLYDSRARAPAGLGPALDEALGEHPTEDVC